MSQKDVFQRSLELHEACKGKIKMSSRMSVESMEDLSLAYTPGVAEPCREIQKNPEEVYRYTSKGNMIAVVTDGSAVLGLGDIGALASLPVMEGKCAIFNRFAGIDAFPVAIDSNDVDEIVRTVKLISPGFGGVNLEDISAPRCFEIEERLKEICDIPIFHDDQHGTAAVVLSGVVNALKVVSKKIGDIKVVINGAGAAGIACCKMLLNAGARNVILCDRNGAIYDGRPVGMNWAKEEIAKVTNPDGEKGSLTDVIKGADLFLGLSGPGTFSKEQASTMNSGAIVFAMANPVPEIFPEEAKEAGVAVVGTGRSDYPNQINNSLMFPGIFRGALDARASTINEEMKLAAAYALASLISDEELCADRIIVETLDPRAVPTIAKAVCQAARDTGVARV